MFLFYLAHKKQNKCFQYYEKTNEQDGSRPRSVKHAKRILSITKKKLFFGFKTGGSNL